MKKLAFVCVYYLDNDDASIIALQLDAINKAMDGEDYTVFAAAERLVSAGQQSLKQDSHVRFPELPKTDLKGNREHAFYLDRLVATAFEEGFDWVCTLDVDSFPVGTGWFERAVSEGHALSAVFREENSDTFLPHPCGMLISRRFYEDFRPEFLPDQAVLKSQPFLDFLASTGQRIDTGIGYAEALWKHKISWQRLVRSNKKNVHHLIGGIYGDAIFHLGALSRAAVFHSDKDHDQLMRLTFPFRSSPILWRLEQWATHRRALRNAINAKTLLDKLKHEPERTLAYLRGSDAP